MRRENHDNLGNHGGGSPKSPLEALDCLGLLEEAGGRLLLKGRGTGERRLAALTAWMTNNSTKCEYRGHNAPGNFLSDSVRLCQPLPTCQFSANLWLTLCQSVSANASLLSFNHVKTRVLTHTLYDSDNFILYSSVPGGHGDDN